MSLLFTKTSIIIYEFKEERTINCDARISKVNFNNISDVLDFQSSKYVEVFKSFLLLGDFGFYGYIDNKCVHRSWVKKNCQTVNIYKLIKYKLKEREFFIHYCETDPSARGKNIYPAVLSKISKDVPPNSSIIIAVNRKNKASIKGIKKAGFSEKKSIFLFLLFGFYFVQTTEASNKTTMFGFAYSKKKKGVLI